MFLIFWASSFLQEKNNVNPPPTWRNKGSNPSCICRPRSNFLVQAIVRLPVAFGAVGPIDPWVSGSRLSQKRDLFVTQFTRPETNMTIRICQELYPKRKRMVQPSNHSFFRCYVSFRGYLSSIFECTELLVEKNQRSWKSRAHVT